MKGNGKAGGIAILIVLGLILAYWKWILGFVAVCLVVWGVYVGTKTAVQRRQARVARERTDNAALAARADAQHQSYLAGEDEGLYGNYLPAPLD